MSCLTPPCPQSYGGGRDIVGLGDTTLLRGQEFKQVPIFDDGLIEVGDSLNVDGVVALWRDTCPCMRQLSCEEGF